jgi:hypothetical protein
VDTTSSDIDERERFHERVARSFADFAGLDELELIAFIEHHDGAMTEISNLHVTLHEDGVVLSRCSNQLAQSLIKHWGYELFDAAVCVAVIRRVLEIRPDSMARAAKALDSLASGIQIVSTDAHIVGSGDNPAPCRLGAYAAVPTDERRWIRDADARYMARLDQELNVRGFSWPEDLP